MAIQASSASVFAENAYGLNNLCFNQPIITSGSNSKPIHEYDRLSISQIIAAQFQNHTIELDHYINTQNERLRMAVQEQRRQQTALLLKRYESKVESILKQRDEEIWRAARKNAELQECVRKMEMERLTWQRFAQESEAMAAALTTTIQRVREDAEAEESCCVETETETETERKKKKMICRCCNSRRSCVIMLPCRHLCSCRDCDAFLDCCPVCNLAKKATFEALL